jgi:hypothetical protein
MAQLMDGDHNISILHARQSTQQATARTTYPITPAQTDWGSAAFASSMLPY